MSKTKENQVNTFRRMKYFFIILILFLTVNCSRSHSPTLKLENDKIITKADLGKKLFFDPILSSDKTISCSSCHKPEYAYSDNRAFSIGVKGREGERNAPSVMNMASRSFYFLDGRVMSLEEQALVPIQSEQEMNLGIERLVKRLKKAKEYKSLFLSIYDSEPNAINIVNALSEFQRSLESNGSAPHDLWMRGIDETLMSDSQQRGSKLFLSERFKCFDCHFGPDFTGDEFKNIGLYDEVFLLDKGRYEITKDTQDIGKFKVPGLRNIELTAPYMHNGMFETLEEVIDYYSNPYDFVEKPINMDSLMMVPINMTEEEKTDLLNYLHSLTDQNIPHRIVQENN